MTTIKFRRDTSTNWTTANPIPAQGEPCYETDTGKLKIGNGSDYYSNLPYVSDGGAATIPVASSTVLGGIKVGENLTITEDGVLSASGSGGDSYTLPAATATTLGGIKVGNNLSIAEDGTLTTSVSTDDCLKTSQVATALNSYNGVYLRNNMLDTVQPKFYTADFGLVTGNVGFINKVSYSATEPSDDEMTEAWTDKSGFFTYGTNATTGFISGSVKFAPASSGSIQVVVKLLKENLIKGIDQNGSAKFSKFEISRNGTDYTEVTTFNNDSARYIRFTFDYDYSSYSYDVFASFLTRIRVSWSYNDTFGASDTIALGVNYDNSTIKLVDGKLVASAPDNMVTTDTAQTISGSKTFSKSITTQSIYPQDEITFNSEVSNRYINNVESISSGYHLQGGYISLGGATTIKGDDKLVLDGADGGITLQANSGKLITCSNTVLCSSGLYADAVLATTGNSIISANTDKSVSVGQYQYNTILNNPVVAFTSATNSSLYFTDYQHNKTKDCITYNNGAIEIYAASGTAGTTDGTSFRVTDLMKTDLLSVDFNGNITGNGKTYINSENIDTTYMKWDSTNSKLTVDTAAIAHLAMPSTTSVTLTLGASGTTYTAPADGYISISATSAYSGWIKVDTRPGCFGYANSTQFLTNCPVVGNTSFKVWYTFSSGAVENLQYTFIYCVGSVPSSTEPDF